MSTSSRLPKTVSRKVFLSKGFRSGYSCPTPTNITGVDVTLTIDNAAPPLASASLFVRIEPWKFVCA